MRKAVLNPNALTLAKQDFQVEGFTFSNRIIQRDAISLEVGQIDRPDKTVLTNGRTEPGEFNITLDAADDIVRQGYYDWWRMSVDAHTGLQGRGRGSINQADRDNEAGADRYGDLPNVNNFNITGDIPSNTTGAGRAGIDGGYKRKALITMYRLFLPNSGTIGSQTPNFGDDQPLRILVYGAWCKSLEFPEYDMESDDAATIQCTISYDDVVMLLR